ncbi:MAG TPA: peptidyl-prolyl cis-trans isomerase [Candidatus Binatus sp.]|jgi:peptidyl-prolyl cis-trans isomerase D|nr:peptidyl-prolyl cis-trans isomerase [Candidatus Binatus sp.]
MLKSIQQRDLDKNRWVKVTMWVLLILISISMVITLVPGLVGGSTTNSPDTVASVGGQDISVFDVQRHLNMVLHGQNVPEMLKGLYAKQVLDQMIFSRALDLEAQRLGISVTSQEESDRIKQLLPAAWEGGAWTKDRYVAEVQNRTGMSVPEFESFLRDDMLMEKFRRLVTSSISVSPAEIENEFRRRNEKVQIEYALVKPTELASSIQPTDAELSAYYAKNASRYQVPEKRSARYALLDLAKLRDTTQVSDEDLRAYYNSHIDQYKVENRAHVEHILFKTIGKTDAEIAEIRQKAEDVLKKAKSGANFEDLAKKYSEDDATKAKGGDLGWIVEKQTVPEFEQAAFSVPKGSVSDLVKTQYGFHIIKVLDRETAHTKPFEEVRSTIVPILADQKAAEQANNISTQMASAVRQSNRQSLDDLARKFNLKLGDTPPASVTDPVGDLGNSPELHQILFQLRPGELSQPLQIPQGFVILTPKDIQPAHQGTLAEVRDKVLADYQQEKSIELARTKAQELAKRVQSGESFDQAAKALGLTAVTPEAFARNGSVPDVGSAKLLQASFGMSVGQVSPPTQVAGNWLVYRVVGHQPANPADLATQSDQIKQQLLQAKQTAAFEAFRAALEDRLKTEGKLTINADAMKRLSRTS